jgi:dephospho-CoA kinase
MGKNIDWQKLIRRMELLLRLKSFPVGLKLLTDKKDLDIIPFLRRTGSKVTLCQLISRVRSFDWTVGAELDDFLFPSCPSILGFTDLPETHKDGTFRNIVWTATKEDGRKFEAAIPRLPLGAYQAVAMAPQVYNPFIPDMILIYANPAQIMLLINAIQFKDYEVMQFYCVGESSCSDAIVRCHNTGKPSLSIPCYGERRYGHAQDDELVMALPASMMEKALSGLEALYRRGVRYPISYAGAEGSVLETFPSAYKNLDNMMEKVRGKDNRLVVGLTGSIACGKSAVSDMLQSLGSPLIDFDLIARQVVEPGTKALEQIVDYFGKQVLRDDGWLDRDKLSKIVFGDMEKRKKLENFTHPPIYDGFFNQLNEITAKDPDAIIQVAVPLLIELNLQFLFDKLIVVHLSPEKQVQRLAERDGISVEEAATKIQSQLPIDEKLGFADFIIRNDESLEETRHQVQAVWSQLKEMQKQKAAGAKNR